MTTPPIYTHASNLYQAFERAAVEVDESMAHDMGVPVGDLVFIGHWSTTFVNDPYLPGESTQQKAYGWLQSIGCLEVLRRGGRDYPGVIHLVRPPTVEDAKTAPPDTRIARRGPLGVVENSVKAHTERIDNLEEAVDVLNQQHAAYIRDVELQLRKLSARMDEALARDKE
jgi:hypothetical protein